MKEHILVVDDEEDIVELVRYNLVKAGYDVASAVTGEDGLEKARMRIPDLLVLDLMLPGIDGLEVCKQLKKDKKTDKIPIIILTAKADEADVVAGLELGADDYLVKPFSPRVLLARIQTVLRRSAVDRTSDPFGSITVDQMLIDLPRHEVRISDQLIDLTRTEFRILHFLACRPTLVFTRQQIVDDVHGEDYPVTGRSIDTQIVALRKKLGGCGAYIQTVRGVGYRFQA